MSDTHLPTKPAITRLARRSGVKSMSEDCIPLIQSLISIELNNVLRIIDIVNKQNNTKTIMPTDFYNALKFNGKNILESNDL